MYSNVDKSLTSEVESSTNEMPMQRSKGVHQQKMISSGPRVSLDKSETFLSKTKCAPYAFDPDQEDILASHPQLHRFKNALPSKSISDSDCVSEDEAGKLSLSGKNNQDSPSDEFFSDSDDLFQQTSIPSNIPPFPSPATSFNEASTSANTFPSAKILRGGQAVIARGRHANQDVVEDTSAFVEENSLTLGLWKPITCSTRSSFEGRANRDSFESGMLQPLSSRLSGQKLTLGLKVDGRMRKKSGRTA